MLESFDRWNTAARRWIWLHLFAWLCRAALFVALLPSGWSKLAGHRPSRMSLQNAGSFFLESAYSTGVYWRSLGLAQWLVAALIIVPRTRTLGAALAFPLMLNLFLIALSITRSWAAELLMLLGSLFLVAWDWPRMRRAGRALLFEAEEAAPTTGTASSLKP